MNTASITTVEVVPGGRPRALLAWLCAVAAVSQNTLSAATSCYGQGAPEAMILASVRQIAGLPAPRVAHCPEHRARRTPRRPLW